MKTNIIKKNRDKNRKSPYYRTYGLKPKQSLTDLIPSPQDLSKVKQMFSIITVNRLCQVLTEPSKRATLQPTILATTLKDNSILISGGVGIFSLCVYFCSIREISLLNILGFNTLTNIATNALVKIANNSYVNSQDGIAKQNYQTCELFYNELLKQENIEIDSNILDFLFTKKNNPILEYFEFYKNNKGINIQEILNFPITFTNIYKSEEDKLWNKDTCEQLYIDNFEEYISNIAYICNIVPNIKYDFGYNIADIFIDDNSITKNKTYAIFYCLFKLYDLIIDKTFADICTKTIIICFTDLTNHHDRSLKIFTNVLKENTFKIKDIVENSLPTN